MLEHFQKNESVSTKLYALMVIHKAMPSTLNLALFSCDFYSSLLMPIIIKFEMKKLIKKIG